MTYMRVFKKENPVSGLDAVLVRDTVRLQVEAIRVSIVVPVRVVGGVLKVARCLSSDVLPNVGSTTLPLLTLW